MNADPQVAPGVGARSAVNRVSLEEQVLCAERELEKRRAFYPKWVAGGRMTQSKADREIAAMEAILFTLRNTKQPLLI
jgi:hypothetical protein